MVAGDSIKNLEANRHPLTENLFNLYFEGEITTPEELSGNKIYLHKIVAKFDNGNHMLLLHLLMRPKMQSKEEEPGGQGENIVIQFSFIKGKLKFIDLSMAG